MSLKIGINFKGGGEGASPTHFTPKQVLDLPYLFAVNLFPTWG